MNLLNKLNRPISNNLKNVVIFLLTLGFLYLLIYAYGKSMPNRFQAWQVGDWLINYSGGFVRRGLGGTFLIGLAGLIDVRPEILVFFVKLISYAAIYFGVIWLIKKIQITTLEALMIVSPLTYFFPILDMMGSGRKELILLASYSIWAVMAVRKVKLPTPKTLSLIFLMFTGLHEGLFFFYPLLILVMPIIFCRREYEFKEILVILLPSASLILFLIFGATVVDDKVIMDITKAIDPINFRKWDAGAIDALRWTTAESFGKVSDKFGQWSLLSFFCAIIFFIAPFWLSIKSRSLISNLHLSKYAIAFAFFAQLPLFIISLDWGRWLYITASILCITYLTVRANHNADLKNEKNCVPDQISSKQTDGLTAGFFIILLTLITISYRIDHCCVKGVGWGVLTKPLVEKFSSY